MSATVYERIVDKLHDLDLRPRTSYSGTTALCPSRLLQAGFPVRSGQGRQGQGALFRRMR